jgi:hypothetical protein
MSLGEMLYVVGALVAVMLICSLPIFGSLKGAGPRYRTTLLWQLCIGWGLAGVLSGWLALGWFALGSPWWEIYREASLLLMGAFFPLLVVGIRAGNRSATAAQAADRARPA